MHISHVRVRPIGYSAYGTQYALVILCFFACISKVSAQPVNYHADYSILAFPKHFYYHKFVIDLQLQN